jgi:hypothetical protein
MVTPPYRHRVAFFFRRRWSPQHTSAELQQPVPPTMQLPGQSLPALLLLVALLPGLVLPELVLPPAELAHRQPSSHSGRQHARVVHMRADGSDRHAGATNGTAVRTLTRAHELVRSLILGGPPAPIEVHIAPGRYSSRRWYDYRAKWPSNDTMPESTITFMPAPAAVGVTTTPWPVTFDGCAGPAGPCPGGTFFQVFASAPTADERPRPTNLVFQGIRLANFSQGFVFAGQREKGPGWALSHNTVRDSFLERMGNVFNTSLCPCCGAIATIHAHSSDFSGNIFTDIVGVQRGAYLAEHMHVFYLSNNSTRNVISNNTILRAFGDPFRIRDASSDNQITGNVLSQAGAESAFEEWFCDLKVDAKVCAHHAAECPSWNNRFSSNLLDGNFACLPLAAACLCQPSEDYCGTPPPGSARVITVNNRHTAAPCSLTPSDLLLPETARWIGGGAAAGEVCGRPGPGLGPEMGAPCNYTSSSSSSNHNVIAANRSRMLMHGTEESLKCP